MASWQINIDGVWHPVYAPIEKRYQAYVRRTGSAYYENSRAAFSFASMLAATTTWDPELKQVVNVTYRIRRVSFSKQ